MISQQEERAKRSGRKFADYLKQQQDNGAGERRAAPIAETRLLRSLALGQLAADDKIEVSQDDMTAEIEKLLKTQVKRKRKPRSCWRFPISAAPFPTGS